MTVTKDILNAGLAAQAANLALSNVPRRKRKRSLVIQARDNLFGISFIQAESQMIGGL